VAKTISHDLSASLVQSRGSFRDSHDHRQLRVAVRDARNVEVGIEHLAQAQFNIA